MEINRSDRFTARNSNDRTLIVVADFMNGSSNVLDFAGAVASRCNAQLELFHVIDPGKTRPAPVAENGARSNLEKFTRKMRSMGTRVAKLLSFGSPEVLIAKRAAEIDAKLIVFPLTGSAADRDHKKLVTRLAQRCACPVLALPVERGGSILTELAEASKLHPSIHKPVVAQQSTAESLKQFEVKPVPLLRGA